MATSGTYAFAPDYVDIVLDAFDRCGIRPAAITPDHMFSARRSLNQVLVRWSNRQINLWTIEEVNTPLTAGQQVFACPVGTVAVMEVWARNYQLSNPEDVTPACSTTIASTHVTVTLADHGMEESDWVSIVIPVAIGGVVIQGFYQVYSVPSTSTFIIVADAATSSAGPGGVVPVFTTVLGSYSVNVDLINHGYVAGENFSVQVQTEVGGLFLLGEYPITAVTANTLTITANSAAAAADVQSENDGLMQIATQLPDALPTDRIISPISRTDWAAISTKTQTTPWPTSFWFDRQASPSLYIWPISDGSAPQELRYFRMRQIQDADPQNTETPDIPYRFEEALCAELASHLAYKWAPDAIDRLEKYAADVWAEAAREDRERVSLNIAPQLSGYYN